MEDNSEYCKTKVLWSFTESLQKCTHYVICTIKFFVFFFNYLKLLRIPSKIFFSCFWTQWKQKQIQKLWTTPQIPELRRGWGSKEITESRNSREKYIHTIIHLYNELQRCTLNSRLILWGDESLWARWMCVSHSKPASETLSKEQNFNLKRKRKDYLIVCFIPAITRKE